MATKKQILLPIAILSTGIAGYTTFSALKQPPQEKPVIDNTPVVNVQIIDKQPMMLNVNSYGIVNAKYETELVAQVKGEIIYLSDAFVKGGFVKKGQILAKIDPSDYEAALIDAEAALASAKATLVQEKAYGKVAEEEWKRIENSIPTELSLRKPQLAQEEAKLYSTEAGVKRAKRDLERTVIKAPYDALIDDRAIGLGSYVSTGNKLGHLLSTEHAEVRLPIADMDIRYLPQHGLEANVTLTGNYAGETTHWSGKVVRNEGVVDNKSRMIYLVAEITDPYALTSDKAELRFGSYVTASIEGKQAQDVTTLARHLVINGKIAILDQDNKLKYQDIDIVREQGTQVVISNGLEDGMRVITSALDYPIEGMKLTLPNQTSNSQDKLEASSETASLAAKE